MHCSLQLESVAAIRSIECFVSKEKPISFLFLKKMHFPYVLGVILLCLTIACNGQFKILGLLDASSEINSGKVENIRSLDEVSSDAADSSDLSETIQAPESVDVNKENVNFIKPYEMATNEWKKDFVETTTSGAPVKNITSNVLISDEAHSENISGKDVAISDSDAAAIFESSTMRTTTITAKTYRSKFSRRFSHKNGILINKLTKVLRTRLRSYTNLDYNIIL